MIILERPKVDPEVIRQQEIDEAFGIQRELHFWLFERKNRGLMKADILDVETTNARLVQAGWSVKSRNLTPSQICEVLGVDGILTSNFELTRPMSTEVALALGVLLDVWETTHEAFAMLEIHDANSKRQIWSHRETLNGSVGSTHSKMVNDLMKRSSRKMPWIYNRRLSE